MYSSYDYGYTAGQDAVIGAMGMFFVIFYLFVFAISIFQIVCVWKVYKKAGKGGWEAIIPIYNNIVLLEITDLPLWYIVLSFIPIANIYFVVKVSLELARKFNKSSGFGVGLFLVPVVFYAILAFEKENTYIESNQNQDNVVTNDEGSKGSKFCHSCGNKLAENAQFCPNCGTKIE